MTDARPDWLKRQFPFAPHYLDLGGYRMHYVDEGRGPAVVMLHGNPTWSFFFRRAIESLSDRFRVIVPDHIGCGLSDKPAVYEYTLASRINDVRRLIDVLERLVAAGNTVLVIEHNLDVIKCADYLIDLGPEGGDKGGEVVAHGTPEEVAKVKGSYTGKYLKQVLSPLR